MATTISRRDIARILQQWQDGTLTAAQVHRWAEVGYGQADLDDWEGAEEQSVANEVLAALDRLDMNLILSEDIPIYLRFLNTPDRQFAEGYRLFEEALGQIDYGARKIMLKALPIYAPFCE